MARIVMILILLVVVGMLKAQQSTIDSLYTRAEQKKVTIGLRVGYLSSSLQGKDLRLLSTASNPSSSNGWLAGITVNTRMGNSFGIKSEFLLARPTTLLSIKDSVSNQPYNSKFSSLVLFLQPIMPTVYIKHMRLYSGPFVSVLLNGSIQRKGNDGALFTDKSIFGTSTSPGGYRQKVDIGIVAGIDYEFRNGMVIGISYRRGFVPVMEDTRQQNKWRIYNQQLMLAVGFNF